MTPKPMFTVTVLEHAGGTNHAMIRLRFIRQDHTVPPVDFYVEGREVQAEQLEGLLAELKGSELDPGAVVDRVTRDYDLQECAMRIYTNWLSNPELSPGETAHDAFNAAEAFIAEAKRREEEE